MLLHMLADKASDIGWLEAKLQAAVSLEDYADAARIKSLIDELFDTIDDDGNGFIEFEEVPASAARARSASSACCRPSAHCACCAAAAARPSASRTAASRSSRSATSCSSSRTLLARSS